MACKERAAALGVTAKRRNKNMGLIPEIHTNKRGFVQTGIGPLQQKRVQNTCYYAFVVVFLHVLVVYILE